MLEKDLGNLVKVVLGGGVERALVEGLGHRPRVVLQQHLHGRHVTRP